MLLVQPADSFVISKIKYAWTKRWESKKVEMIREQQWSIGARRDGGWSGKLLNPGKRYFLQLAADSDRDVCLQRDANGLTCSKSGDPLWIGSRCDRRMAYQTVNTGAAGDHNETSQPLLWRNRPQFELRKLMVLTSKVNNFTPSIS